MTTTPLVGMSYDLCPVCFVQFAMPARMDEIARETGSTFYCPAGHSLSYKDSEVMRLRKRVSALELERQTLAAEAARERERRQKAERTIDRAQKGVCTLCRRSFPNVARHMKTKHAKPAKVGATA